MASLMRWLLAIAVISTCLALSAAQANTTATPTDASAATTDASAIAQLADTTAPTGQNAASPGIIGV